MPARAPTEPTAADPQIVLLLQTGQVGRVSGEALRGTAWRVAHIGVVPKEETRPATPEEILAAWGSD